MKTLFDNIIKIMRTIPGFRFSIFIYSGMKPLQYALLLSFLLFNSCVKEPLFPLPEKPATPPTPTPTDSLSGILVRVDWEEVEASGTHGNFSVTVNPQIVSLSTGTQPDTFRVAPGNYDAYVYNQPAGITFTNETASMNVNGNGNIVTPATNAFFSGVMTDITAEMDNTTEVTVKPVQCIRQLTINFTVPDSILYDTLNPVISISGKLDHVARSFNMRTGTEENAGTVVFDLMTSSSINIFGFIGQNQTLTVEMHYNNGTSKNAEVNIGYEFIGFNTDKKQPKEITVHYFSMSFE